MAKRGRKSYYTPEMHKQIVDTLATGVSIHDVCAYVGIDEDTYHLWCRTKSEFLQATLRARVMGRIGAAAVVRRAAIEGDTEAAQWYLERTDPVNWGRKNMLIALGLDGKLLKELKAQADKANIDLAQVFEAMINEFAHVDTADDSAG
jgi:hypothetical protein